MSYPSIDKLLNIVDSKYELVHIAARRSKQISRDGYLQMPESEYKSSKNIGIIKYLNMITLLYSK